MRIVMLAQFVYPPSVGGEERFVADLSRELVERGHTVAIVTHWLQGLPEFEIHQGVRIYRVRGTMQRMKFLFSESTQPYSPPFPDPEVMRALRRILLAEQPDIIHAHNWFARSFVPLKIWSKAKFVVSLHDYSLICVQKRLMQQNTCCTGPGAIKCLACGTHYYGFAKGPLATSANFYWGKKEMQAVDMFLPVSQVVVDGNQLDKHRVPYRIVPNFIPDSMEVVNDDNHPLLSQLPKDGFLLFVGDISFDKGAEVLLQAYAMTNTCMPLVFIGRSFLADTNQQLPPNVFFMGAWPHNAVMGAWKRCTIGLVPSIVADACPTVAMEAMTMGKAVVAARSGGLTDIVVDGETGLLVSPGDPDALRGAIQYLLDHPERRKHMGILGQQRVIRFQAKSVISRFEQIYRELMDANSTNTRTPVSIGSR